MGEQRSTPEPILTFKGLSYLHHIEQCRVRPVGYDRQGVKYFELVDLVENVQFFTAEVTALNDDLVLKDKYGIIRFCVHGWDKMQQMDVYVNIKKPVGIVKNFVFYDYNLIPIFGAHRTNLGPFNCFGPSSYRVTSMLAGVDVGYITPEPASIHLKFDQLLDEGPKALLVAFGLQLALAKFKFLNLPLTKVRYLYKDREKAKAKKAAQRLAEQQKLKGSRLGSAVGDGVTLVPVVPTVISIPICMPQPMPGAPSSRRPTQDEGQPKILISNVAEASPAPVPAPQLLAPPRGSAGETEIPPSTIPSPCGSNVNSVLVKVSKRKVLKSRAGSMRNVEERRETTVEKLGKLSVQDPSSMFPGGQGKLSLSGQDEISALDDAINRASGLTEVLKTRSKSIVRKKSRYRNPSTAGDNQTDFQMSEMAPSQITACSPSKSKVDRVRNVSRPTQDTTAPPSRADTRLLNRPARDPPATRAAGDKKFANSSPRAAAPHSPVVP